MNKSIRILIFGLVTILGFNGCTEKKDMEVLKNSIDNVVYSDDYDNFDLTVKTNPSHGSARRYRGGGDVIAIYYTPDTDYIGKDQLIIFKRAKDHNLDQDVTITVNITVKDSDLTRSNISNRIPISNDQNITIDYETPTDFNITASDADNDTFTFVIESNTANGTIILIDETTGDVTYTPNLGYSGPDHFTFKVVDEFNASSNVADVNITVKSLCDMDPTATGCPEDPCLANPTMTPGCPGYDPCLLDPTATGCPLDPCLLDPTATGCPLDPCLLDPTSTGCPLDPCIIDPFSIECQNSIQI